MISNLFKNIYFYLRIIVKIERLGTRPLLATEKNGDYRRIMRILDFAISNQMLDEFVHIVKNWKGIFQEYTQFLRM